MNWMDFFILGGAFGARIRSWAFWQRSSWPEPWSEPRFPTLASIAGARTGWAATS